MGDGIEVRVGPEPLDLAGVFESLPDESHGAQVLFVGVVRGNNLGRRVTAVSYDAFEPLAEKTLRDICLEARERFGQGLRFVVWHRTGQLGVGEASVALGVGGPHRAETYEASRYVIEELKVRVPIWKKEHYENGETEWLHGHALCGHSSTQPNHKGDHGSADHPRHAHHALRDDGNQSVPTREENGTVGKRG